ncbi:hypothetical protein Lepto7376_4276 [[Leptolyngbya] sp. PCC 7376]|uniref:hypothetical protein n=1 Tax=[Leptolyngbya] sp. PCC 7376 TaxID=111781 RepID=UPI00029F3919|nr:hypothetical protein [[Leptolyngbya] sp. PCC 7376]AFY40386.1 hypothetical protein Lepto7376_4276 [[Leptolyngbya] sp. PCC 7376]
MAELTGKIEKRNVGVGTWALVATDSQVYELRKLSSEFQQPDLNVTVTGQVLENAMSIAMIGPIFEVQSCTKI